MGLPALTLLQSGLMLYTKECLYNIQPSKDVKAL